MIAQLDQIYYLADSFGKKNNLFLSDKKVLAEFAKKNW